jgi:sugar lactone lactonase YvrE
MKVVGTYRHNFGIGTLLAYLSALALVSGSLDAFASRPLPPNKITRNLSRGDIIYADSGNALDGGIIVKVDPLSGEQVVLSSGGLLIQPFDPAIDQSGRIVVSDTSGRLIRVDPATGLQTLLTDNSAGMLGMPCGIGLDRRGGVLVANTQSIVRVDPVTGQIQPVSTGGHFMVPIGIAVAATGEIFVLNTGPVKQIIRVNPRNGSQSIVSEAGLLNNPQALALSGLDLYVTDVATPDGNFGIGRVLRVDVLTGTQTVIAEGGYLVGPVGISSDENGSLIVGDPYTLNPNSPTLFDGGVIKIDSMTGGQTLLVRGQGNHVNPRGIAVLGGLKAR